MSQNYETLKGNNLVISPIGNYEYTTVQDYKFTCVSTGKVYIIPAGFTSDGASIPRAFWSILGGPFCPKNLEAAFQHDYLISINLDGDYRDLQFYSTLVSRGTDKWKAKLMYLGVVAWRKLKTFLT